MISWIFFFKKIEAIENSNSKAFKCEIQKLK